MEGADGFGYFKRKSIDSDESMDAVKRIRHVPSPNSPLFLADSPQSNVNAYSPPSSCQSYSPLSDSSFEMTTCSLRHHHKHLNNSVSSTDSNDSSNVDDHEKLSRQFAFINTQMRQQHHHHHQQQADSLMLTNYREVLAQFIKS